MLVALFVAELRGYQEGANRCCDQHDARPDGRRQSNAAAVLDELGQRVKHALQRHQQRDALSGRQALQPGTILGCVLVRLR